MGFGRKSPLEQRLKELEREASLVRKDMKVLSRAIQKPDVLERLPPLKSGESRRPVRPAVRRDPVQASEERAAQKAVEEGAPHGELFQWAPRRSLLGTARNAARAEESVEEGAGPAEGKGRVRPVQDERFRAYFGNGSFVASRPLKQERRIQRNKALFMLIVVLFFGFMVLKMFL